MSLSHSDSGSQSCIVHKANPPPLFLLHTSQCKRPPRLLNQMRARDSSTHPSHVASSSPAVACSTFGSRDLGPNSKNRIFRKSAMPPRMDSMPRNCSFSLSDLVCLLFLAAPDEKDTIELCVLTFDFPPAGVIERPHQWRGGGGGASLWHRLKMPLKR